MAEAGPSALPQPSVLYSGNDNRGVELGYNSGTVNNYLNGHPQTSTSTKPKPFSNIPFKRNPEFVDRDGMLEKIRRGLSEPAARVALVGLGGIGKSQLAIEHCYLAQETSSTAYVFWVHASNEARFEQSVKDIAVHLKLYSRKEATEKDVFQRVRDWLLNEDNGPWILVVDNADDPAVFFARDRHDDYAASTSKNFADFLPQSRNGKIIITSRYEKVALRLVQGPRDLLKVSPMTPNEALSLLRKKMDVSHDDESSAAELVETLDYIPLAIDQACAYIMQRKPRTSIARYLEDLRTSETVASTLLMQDPGNMFRDSAASSSILTTWRVSWDYIRSHRPSAIRLLSLMSYFNCQGIPDFLLLKHRPWYMNDGSETYCLVTSNATSLGPTLSGAGRALKKFFFSHRDDNQTRPTCKLDPEAAQDLHAGCKHTEWSSKPEFEEDVHMLRNFSLISTNVDGSTFQMHPLVQLASRIWLKDLHEEEDWKDMIMEILSSAFPPYPHYEEWNVCKLLLPHVDVGANAPLQGHRLQCWAQLLTSVAYYMYGEVSYTASNEAASKVLEAFKLHGDGLFESDTATRTKKRLSWVLLRVNKGSDAEQIIRDLLRSQMRILGEDDKATVQTMGILASTLVELGKLDEAEILLRKSLEKSQAIYGEHPYPILVDKGNLGDVLLRKGKSEEALGLFRELEKEYQTLIGEHHLETLVAMARLSDALFSCGHSKEAESLLQRLLPGNEELYGMDHPQTSIAKRKLGLLYGMQGRNAEAEIMLRRALVGLEIRLGKEHDETRATKHSMVECLRRQRKWSSIADLDPSLQAEEWYGKEDDLVYGDA